ncbi:aminotransferase class V-fold PLP-dependent enzyme [Myxococcaceae bacterium GXIMD 01537]
MNAPSFRSRWSLDPEVTFLNHGSFGACPTEVLAFQAELRARLEAEPVLFLHRQIEPLLDAARAALGAFVGADADDLAFVANATTGVNTVLRSLRFAPGDELLTTDHEYNASRNALDFVASQWGARVVVAKVPWPVTSEDAVVDAVLAHVTPRTRLLLIDHVTSQTALVMPVARLVRALRERGVETLVDAAHAPGMLPLDLRELGAGYYTGNCHKWISAPKGAAFLHVRRDLQGAVRPLAMSHGYNSTREDRSRFRREFDWMGTHDPTPFLSVPKALEVMGGLLPGGWPELMASNHAKAVAARSYLCERLRVAPSCPEAMLGSMATVSLPESHRVEPRGPLAMVPLQERLFDTYRIEVPVSAWPAPPRGHLRVSAQLYNTPPDYQRLGDALEALLR